MGLEYDTATDTLSVGTDLDNTSTGLANTSTGDFTFTQTSGTSNDLTFTGGGITSGQVLISDGTDGMVYHNPGGWAATGSGGFSLTIGPFTLSCIDNGDLKVVLNRGGKEKEFHIPVDKVLALLYSVSTLVIEEPEDVEE